MLSNFFQQLVDTPEPRERRIKMLGTGATPTLVFGHGVTITRAGAGDYKITFNEFCGTYLDATYALESTAMTDLKNFSVVFKPFDATNRVVEFTLFNASGTATDLAAAQWITVLVDFAMIASALA